MRPQWSPRSEHEAGETVALRRVAATSKPLLSYDVATIYIPVVFDDLISSWDGDEVVVRFDRPTGTWMFVGIHSLRLGPACGGTRMKTYRTPADALSDALRLSAAMTLKMAAANMPFGGGKAVLAVPGPLEGAGRRGLMLRYGDLVASLGGNFHTGPDMNTSPADMDVVGERSPHVVCRSIEHGGSGDPGPHTANGVFHGIRATVRHRFGSADLSARVILVQGVGDVGAPLAEQLAAAGARVLVSDIAAERARSLAGRIGARVVPPDQALRTECDVYAPCALGATLSKDTIPALRCGIVAGSANNQLAEPEDAERLRTAGILYAPDFVINAGGVLYAWGLEALGWSRDIVEERHVAIGETLREIYSDAEQRGITTEAAAEELARRRLATGTELSR